MVGKKRKVKIMKIAQKLKWRNKQMIKKKGDKARDASR